MIIDKQLKLERRKSPSAEYDREGGIGYTIHLHGVYVGQYTRHNNGKTWKWVACNGHIFQLPERCPHTKLFAIDKWLVEVCRKHFTPAEDGGFPIIKGAA